MREIPSAKNLVLPVLIVGAIFIAQWMRAQQTLPIWHYEGQIMGTTFTIKVIHPIEVAFDPISKALEQVNEKMSTYLADSELSKLNQGPSNQVLPVSSELRVVLQAARKVSRLSNDFFDITVGPLVNAWGFGPNKERKEPSRTEIETLKAYLGSHLWKIGEEGVIKQNQNLYLDLSAIAKGYAVDQVAKVLDKNQVLHYWIEVGGEVRVKGQNAQKKAWRVGIERPAGKEKRRIYKILNLSNMSVATSGDYRNRYLDSSGKVRSHTINPKTGEPVSHLLASVSVLHEECMYADAWATALNVMGMEDGLKLADQLGLAALFIQREGVTPKEVDLDGKNTKYKAYESKVLKQLLGQRK